jgi:NitT/TauT family transport system permease protein
VSATNYAVDTAQVAPTRLFRVLHSRRLARGLLSVLGGLTFIGIWAFVSGTLVEEFVLPPPWDVAQNMWELLKDGSVWSAFGATLYKTLMGWGAALVLGIPMGLLMGRYRYASAFFHDLVYQLANVPLIVYAVLSLIVFGISPLGPAFVVMLAVLPAIAINVAAGVESADEGLLAMSRAFRRNRRTVRRAVIYPAVFPFLLAAGRVSFADSWKLAALAETFGGASGIGFELQKSFTTFSVLDALSWMMFFVIFVIIVERLILAPTERRLFVWRSPGGAPA